MKPLPPTHRPSPKTLLLTAALLFSALQTATAQPDCINPPSGLIAWWRGENKALDQQGTNHGTLQNGATYTAGPVGTAFSLDGVDDFVEVADRPSLNTPNGITVMGWLRHDGGGGAIASKWDSLAQERSWALLLIGDGKLRFTLSIGNADTVATVVSNGVFTHVAATCDVASLSIKIYVNGVEFPTSGPAPVPGATIQDSAAPLWLGKRRDGDGSQDFFGGLLDEMDLYDRALGSNEIAAIYAAGAAGKCTSVIFVPGTATPYLAGLPNGSLASVNAPEPPDVAPQQSPVLVASFSPQPNTALSFRATGGVGYAPGTILDPPDGRANFLTTHRNGAEHGISDERAPADSLLGVFLGPDSPENSPAPATLNFATPELRDYTVLMPQLKQVFFIGDGLRANGSNQLVVPPAGATRLYLATTDGFGWANNIGQFLVSVNVSNFVAPFGISPVAVSVDPGTAVTFTASGGTPPYTFTLATNNSGGGITSAGVYTAGTNQSRTDVIRVTDFSGSNALATALVLVVSPPRLELTPTGTNTVTVSWDSAASAFELEFSDSLSPPITWQELSNTNNITDNGTLRTFILVNPPDVPVRFYRLRKR